MHTVLNVPTSFRFQGSVAGLDYYDYVLMSDTVSFESVIFLFLLCCVIPPPAPTHRHTHARTHARTCARAYTRKHARTRACTHTHKHTHTKRQSTTVPSHFFCPRSEQQITHSELPHQRTNQTLKALSLGQSREYNNIHLSIDGRGLLCIQE